jgi:hypothetical protein
MPQKLPLFFTNRLCTYPAANALAMGCFFCSVALATSVREYQNMPDEQKAQFLFKETNDLLARVKAYDPKLEQKTRFYMLDETNAVGGSMGLGAVLDVVSVSVLKRPETMDKAQMETIIKVVIRSYWKSQGITVPASVLSLKEPAVPPQAAPVAAGH